MSAPRVVIVGGGFGGLFATRALAGAAVNVVLIDKRNYHLFRPMLYQVATGLLSADEIAVPLRSIVSRQRNVEVLQDEVTAIDSAQRLIRLKQHQLPYDFLILATGIQYNYFGHDDWRRVAPGLESLDDADLIRGKVLTAFERAEETAALDHGKSEEIQQLLTFVLVGAGTVGIEMAGTLAEMSRMALSARFSPYRSALGAYSALRSGAARTSHLSRSLIGQSTTASRKPGRQSVHEHARHQRG